MYQLPKLKFLSQNKPQNKIIKEMMRFKVYHSTWKK